jgi:hypothetical protein
MLVVLVVAAGAVLSFFQILLGLLEIRRGHLRSVRVEDSELLQVVDEFRQALGVKRDVTVREWPELATAATVGWRNPVLLLPRGWQAWTREQRQAVLAHELAHVARNDFLTGLLARVSLAVHFWHPLVRWLAWRFQLQRELAADAQAAPLAGGRGGYLRVLAELALRGEGRSHGWPAPALLSSQGTLLRRVKMLRVQKADAFRPGFKTGRWLTVGLALSLTLGVSALRGSAPKAPTATPGDSVQQKVASVRPFDLSLLPPCAEGEVDVIYALRPSAILNRPGMALVRKYFNAQVDDLARPLTREGFSIHCEDVEQVLGRVQFGGENKPGGRAVFLTVKVVRTTRDIDWAKLREQVLPDSKLHQWKGETYVRIPMPPGFIALVGVKEACFWAPDARTLVFDREDAIKALIEARTGGKPITPPAYAPSWGQVSKGLLAMGLDIRGQRLLNRILTEEERKALANPKAPEHEFLRLAENASHVVMGFAGQDDLQWDLWVSADTLAQAEAVTRACEGIVAAARKELAGSHGEGDFTWWVNEMLKQVTIRRQAQVAILHAEIANGLSALLAEFADLAPKAK